jgi:alpha-beta hydrolase superfamily lysophospholipase
MNAARLVFIAFLTLAGCAPVTKPAGPPRETAGVTGHFITTEDGARLPLRSWLPAGETTAVVLAVHGFNDYSFAFDEPGKFLANQGIAVFAYDQRGFGAAPDRGYWAGEETMVDDLGEIARLIAARYPGKPLYLLGESMGGALVMVTMTRPHPPAVAGIILSAPAVWSRDSMNVFERSALWFFSHVTPWMPLSGKGLDIQASDNIEMLRQLGRDPLIIKETRVDAIHGLCDLMDDAMAAAPRLRVPTLVLYGEHDEVVPAEPVHRVMESLPTTPSHPVVAIYAEGWHMLLRDLESDLVLTDVAAWIREPTKPLPSEADRRAQAVLQREKAPAG